MGFVIKERLPIVFSKSYNISFCGLQCNYPFDTEKGQHILHYLKMHNLVKEENITSANEVSEDELLEVHTQEYLDSLKISDVVSKISEIPLLHFVPNYFVQVNYLRPLRYQVGGSLKAAKLALKYGWAINLGGGFSHCSSDAGGSFSAYADITLIAKHMLLNESRIRQIMIIDLTSRQGNGYQRDLMDIKQVYIFDIYNNRIYPQDEQAKFAISKKIELPNNTTDEVYLRKLRINLKKALEEFTPDYVIYVAGTDIVEGDSLGEINCSGNGVLIRDEVVFSKIRGLNIPIVMLLSTGFLKSSFQIIANSIVNLKEKDLLPSKCWES